MLYPVSRSYSDTSDIFIAGHSLKSLASTFQTPLHVLCQQSISDNISKYTQALRSYYPESKVLFAGKANLSVGICSLMAHYKLGLDVVSGGELYTALKSNMPSNDIFYHGNHKPNEVLSIAIDQEISIVLDNPEEVHRLASLCPKNKIVNIYIRVKPDIEVHTHRSIKTGHSRSKFGIKLSDLPDILSFIQQHPKLRYQGLHTHLGSQLFDKSPYIDGIKTLAEIAEMIFETYQMETSAINIGGGIGIPYTEDQVVKTISIDSFIKSVAEIINSSFSEKKLPKPKLFLEPGRSIIGTAGITLYSIVAIKEIDNHSILIVDGGMTDNPRPMLYHASYSYDLISQRRIPSDKNHCYSIEGQSCESGDILSHGSSFPFKPERGDFIVVYSTGAYNYSMSMHYNRTPHAPSVLVKEGQHQLLVERESWEDLVKNDVIITNFD